MDLAAARWRPPKNSTEGAGGCCIHFSRNNRSACDVKVRMLLHEGRSLAARVVATTGGRPREQQQPARGDWWVADSSFSDGRRATAPPKRHRQPPGGSPSSPQHLLTRSSTKKDAAGGPASGPIDPGVWYPLLARTTRQPVLHPAAALLLCGGGRLQSGLFSPSSVPPPVGPRDLSRMRRMWHHYSLMSSFGRGSDR